MEKTVSLYTIRTSSSKVLSLSAVNVYESPFTLGRASKLGNALEDENPMHNVCYPLVKMSRCML
jgi:hypothetical protein